VVPGIFPIFVRRRIPHSVSQWCLAAALFWLTTAPALAVTYVLPPEDVDLVGRLEWVRARQSETLLDIARRYDIGQDEIVAANPKVDRWLPGDGTRVLLPRRYILPRAPRRGIVLNTSEMRLYYYPKQLWMGKRLVITHPVSIGRMDWQTPLGLTQVVAKVRDPVWRPPASIKAEHAAEGDPLPQVFPAGPDNPLGQFALRLGLPGYLIHGTNKPFGVGMRVSHGCVRMYPEDIAAMFPQVEVGTPVHIVDQPIKAGWSADTLYLEVHPPLEEERERDGDLVAMAMRVLARAADGRPVLLDGAKVILAVREMRGVPVPVSRGFRDPGGRTDDGKRGD